MLGSETVKGLGETMQMLNNALNRPVLHENEFKKETV